MLLDEEFYGSVALKIDMSTAMLLLTSVLGFGLAYQGAVRRSESELTLGLTCGLMFLLLAAVFPWLPARNTLAETVAFALSALVVFAAALLGAAYLAKPFSRGVSWMRGRRDS